MTRSPGQAGLYRAKALAISSDLNLLTLTCPAPPLAEKFSHFGHFPLDPGLLNPHSRKNNFRLKNVDFRKWGFGEGLQLGE